MKITIAARLLLSACCLLALSSSAAIITERNDVYGGIGCYAPSNYTFRGTSAAPGIDSCWIPFGTYTDGVGGAEYLRVTSNLMGVVASALGGAAERAYAIGGYYSSTVGDSFGNWPTLLRPITPPPQSWDFGEYLESATNTSLRLADQLNLGILYKRTGPVSGSSEYPVYPESIEPLLAKTDNYYGYYTFNGGLASSFGSRRLDDMTGNVEPPISSEWSSKIPWSVSDADVWRFVHPVYGKCTNDIHFLPEGGYFGNVLPDPFDTSGDPMALWGNDAYDAFTELNNACTNPLPITIEDVLSADTGWKDNDYTHWRNGTTRLDWKRLGIICQLERQMETTFTSPSSGTDELPFYSLSAHHSMLYKTDVEVNLPVPEYIGQTETLSSLFRNASWSQDSESYNSTTNNRGWATPTCRVPKPTTYGGVTFDPHSGYPVQLSEEDASDIIANLCSQFTNDLVWAFFEGKWAPREGTLDLVFTSFYAEGLVEIQVPSNTVEVATGDGFVGSSWSNLPISRQSGWHFGDALQYFDFNMSPGGSLSMYYENQNQVVDYHGDNFDPTNGTFTTPQIVFSVINGGEYPTNWVWQVSGIDGLATNTAAAEIWDASSCRWTWNREDDPTASAVFLEMFPSWTPPQLYLFIYQTGSSGLGARWTEFWSPDDPTPPREVIIPSISSSWTTSSYSEEVRVHNYDPLTYAITVDPIAETNETRGVLASVNKDSSASFTDHTAATMGDIISRFSLGSLYWDRMKTLRRSDLEMLISGTGDHSMAYSTSPWDDFGWEYLKPYAESYRYFRFLAGTSVSSRGAAESERYIQLIDLDIACKSKCVELGGMPIGSISDFGRITADENALVFNDVKRAEVEAAFRVTGFGYDRYRGRVLWDEDAGEYRVVSISEPGFFPHSAGRYGWNLEVKYEGQTNSLYRAVRTDAHQAPVHKTLWKFKNLRDPNL